MNGFRRSVVGNLHRGMMPEILKVLRDSRPLRSWNVGAEKQPQSVPFHKHRRRNLVWPIPELRRVHGHRRMQGRYGGIANLSKLFSKGRPFAGRIVGPFLHYPVVDRLCSLFERNNGIG